MKLRQKSSKSLLISFGIMILVLLAAGRHLWNGLSMGSSLPENSTSDQSSPGNYVINWIPESYKTVWTGKRKICDLNSRHIALMTGWWAKFICDHYGLYHRFDQAQRDPRVRPIVTVRPHLTQWLQFFSTKLSFISWEILKHLYRMV